MNSVSEPFLLGQWPKDGPSGSGDSERFISVDGRCWALIFISAMSRARRPRHQFQQPHQAAAMLVMDGYPRWMLARAIRGLVGLLAVLLVLGPVAVWFGWMTELASVAVIGGGMVMLIGILPMTAMLAFFHAPPPLILWMAPRLNTFVQALRLVPPARWPAAGLERPPRFGALPGR